jgi:hypothetical protein
MAYHKQNTNVNKSWWIDGPGKENQLVNRLKLEKMLKVLSMISADMKADAEVFDVKPFAESFGNHGAAIAALADALKILVEENNP